jgi:hypothetical protein
MANMFAFLHAGLRLRMSITRYLGIQDSLGSPNGEVEEAQDSDDIEAMPKLIEVIEASIPGVVEVCP